MTECSTIEMFSVGCDDRMLNAHSVGCSCFLTNNMEVKPKMRIHIEIDIADTEEFKQVMDLLEKSWVVTKI